jgi:polysaccharide biosynthesis transport protein
VSEPAYSADSTGAVPNILQSVLRRWPLVLIGALAGTVVAFLAYSTQPAVYQSNAQLQVIKKDNARSDMRFGYIDDYVATQLDVLRSQIILETAAKSGKMKEATPALQERLESDPWSVMKARLTVTRNKESSGMIGNSIVNLTFNSDDPKDTQVALEAIIDTYKKELRSLTSDTMRSRINQLKASRDTNRQSIQKAEIDRQDLDVKRRDITVEAEEVIVQRWGASRNEQGRIELELAQIKSTLQLIEKAGNNRTERAKLLAILTGSRRVGADSSAFTVEGQILALELQRKQFADTLGPDHAQMREIDSKLSMLKQEMRRLNPDDPNGDIDELALYQAQLNQKKSTLEQQKGIHEIRISEDKNTLDRLKVLIPISSQLLPRIAELNKTAGDLDNQINALEAASAAEAQVTVYEAAELNKPRLGARVGPVLFTWLLPGLFVGGLVGAGLALLIELRDKSFRSPAEIRERLGVPVIGHLPTIRLDMPSEADVSADYDPSLVAAVRPKSVEAEAYRGVRAQVLQLSEDKGHQVIQVSSPTPGDGKSTLAANLAISLAQSGKRTVLLDCDFRKPRVHKLFALAKPEVGLASVTGGATKLEEAIRHSDVSNLDLLPCGPRPDNPAELLSGQRFQEVLRELRERYEMVIVDTPPILAVSDPRVVAQRVDGVVMVFRISNKVRPLVERAKEYLTDMGANLLGVVVNGGGKSSEYGYNYGAGYNYTYDYDYQYAEEADDKSKY